MNHAARQLGETMAEVRQVVEEQMALLVDACKSALHDAYAAGYQAGHAHGVALASRLNACSPADADVARPGGAR